MNNDWIEEQRTLIAEKERELSELKAQVTPAPVKSFATHSAPRPEISPLEKYRNLQFYALAILLFVNVGGLLQCVHGIVTWRDSAELILNSEQVQAKYEDSGEPLYVVSVPLKEFPYDVALNQDSRFRFLFLPIVNLVVLGFLVSAYRRLPKAHAEQGPSA